MVELANPSAGVHAAGKQMWDNLTVDIDHLAVCVHFQTTCRSHNDGAIERSGVEGCLSDGSEISFASEIRILPSRR